MTRILSVLTAAAFAGFFSVHAVAADGDAKAQRKQVRADYKADRAKCKDVKPHAEHEACEKDAKAKRDAALKDIKAANKTKGKAASGSTAAPVGETGKPISNAPAPMK